ncbi:DUF881 domain-containing protein [Schaalia suimastitidis]|uniref:DUF881 domain-containing protein n=1 Tax=Schaalia suimastitidis TaxID=121163 RepID=UPI0004113379|nr:DUF881 domain-containing protein [Schaalia suimastitidis]
MNDRSVPSTAATTPGDNDPAASMSLITQILFNPLDAGYQEGAPPPPSVAARVAYKILVAVLAVILGVGSMAAITALKEPQRTDVADDLRQRALEEQQLVTDLETEVQDLGQQVASYAQSASTSVAADPALSLLTASSAVRGPGIVVTIADASQAKTGLPGSGAVRDQDLRMVVNALWSAGAEAISVNGHRIAPGTFIRTAGNSILVNITPIASPYEVTAIGDANAMQTALLRGSTGDYLSSAQSLIGISLTTSKRSEVRMDAMDLRVIRYAQPVTTGEGK